MPIVILHEIKTTQVEARDQSSSIEIIDCNPLDINSYRVIGGNECIRYTHNKLQVPIHKFITRNNGVETCVYIAADRNTLKLLDAIHKNEFLNLQNYTAALKKELDVLNEALRQVIKEQGRLYQLKSTPWYKRLWKALLKDF